MKKKYCILCLCLVILFIVINNYKEKNLNKAAEVDNDFSNYNNYTIDLNNEKIVSITNAGIYTLNGNLDGYIKVNVDGDVKLVLDNVTIENDNGPAILIENSKKIYIELIGENYLSDSKSYNGYDDNVRGVIYSKADLYIIGDGTLNLDANHEDGIVAKNNIYILGGSTNITSVDDGIRSNDSINIENSTINITSSGDGIKAENNLTIISGIFNIITEGNINNKSSKAIKAGNLIEIESGNFKINSYDDAIHSNGTIIINDGYFDIISGDDGVHADNELVINKGDIVINKSYEGLEANTITINDGNISVVASDDGINVAKKDENMGSTSILTINGGNIYVNVSGDGLDANGSIMINGGTIVIEGPTSNGDGALDYDNKLIVNGGTIVAIGSLGMAQNLSVDSKQVGVLINLDTQVSGTLINLEDIITFKPTKQYSSIFISSPNLTENNTYNLSLGGNVNGESVNGLYLDGEYTGGNINMVITISGIVNNYGNRGFNSQGGRNNIRR